MSAIVHRCEKCGHNQLEHRDPICSHGQCGRGMHDGVYGPSELIPTFDKNGDPVERIMAPGSRNPGWWQMCQCADCQALYDSMAVAS